LRPRPLAIAFGTVARAHHTLYFDPDLRIKDVMVEISRAIPATDRANLDRYGLFLDSNDITKPAVSSFYNYFKIIYLFFVLFCLFFFENQDMAR
jgi:hypothetical protein